MEIFEARLGVTPSERVIDPVCGMELSEAGVAARLSIEGKDVAFCSEGCLRMFVERPRR